jgi:hypothetical protein
MMIRYLILSVREKEIGLGKTRHTLFSLILDR